MYKGRKAGFFNDGWTEVDMKLFYALGVEVVYNSSDLYSDVFSECNDLRTVPIVLDKLHNELLNDDRAFSESGKVNMKFIDNFLSDYPLTKRFTIDMLKYQLTFFEAFDKLSQSDKELLLETIGSNNETEIENKG